MAAEQGGKAGKSGGLMASTLVVSAMTLLSRVLGLVRDVVLARFLGVSAGTDAFFVAFRIPNFLRRLFAEGAFNQAFVPVLSEYRTNGPEAAVRQLINRVAGTLGLTLSLVTLVGVIGAPVLITLFAPGFGDDPVKRALAVEMLRLTFPYLFFIAQALANKTGDTKLRAGVPKDWRVGEKTGAGGFGTNNDVGILWPPGRAPLIVAVYLTETTKPLDERNAVIAEVARIVSAGA